MTTGKEKARRLAHGQGQANTHPGAPCEAQSAIAQLVMQGDGRARPATAGWPEPFNHWFTGRSGG